MAFSERDLPVIIKLLDQMAGRREVDDLFRSKGAKFSAPNWAAFVETRLPEALRSKRVTIDDLARLVQEADEHGRQHVLLFRAPKAIAVEALAETRVRRGLTRMDVPTILDEPRVLEMPDEPRLTEARFEYTPKQQVKALVIKQVSTQESLKLVREHREGNRLTYDYEIQKVRSVNVVKIHADGLCEVRIQSHQKPQYHREVSQLLVAVQEVVPTGSLQTYSIAVAKNTLFEKRHELRADVRYTGSILRNDRGGVIQAAAPSETGDLFSDAGMVDSLGRFMAHEGHCDSSNLFFRVGTKPNDEPNWVHVLLSGADNEYALTAQCTMREYEYVLARLREHNR